MSSVSIRAAVPLSLAPMTLPAGGRDGGNAGPHAAGRILFHSGHEGNLDVYVMNADGSRQTRITDNLADDLAPA